MGMMGTTLCFVGMFLVGVLMIAVGLYIFEFASEATFDNFLRALLVIIGAIIGMVGFTLAIMGMVGLLGGGCTTCNAMQGIPPSHMVIP